MPSDRPLDEAMAEIFQHDPGFAIELLNEILAEGEQDELLVVLRQLTQAFGGISVIAEKAHINRTQLYRTLSAKGNPEIRSLSAILKTMGLCLAVQPYRGLSAVAG
jgi:probable addiction module antidote protein